MTKADPGSYQPNLPGRQIYTFSYGQSSSFYFDRESFSTHIYVCNIVVRLVRTSTTTTTTLSVLSAG